MDDGQDLTKLKSVVANHCFISYSSILSSNSDIVRNFLFKIEELDGENSFLNIGFVLLL